MSEMVPCFKKRTTLTTNDVGLLWTVWILDYYFTAGFMNLGNDYSFWVCLLILIKHVYLHFRVIMRTRDPGHSSWLYFCFSVKWFYPQYPEGCPLHYWEDSTPRPQMLWPGAVGPIREVEVPLKLRRPSWEPSRNPWSAPACGCVLQRKDISISIEQSEWAFYFLKDFIYLFLERRERREKER